jgi:hypothetical protein
MIRSDSCRAYLRTYLENAPSSRPGFKVDAAAATMDEQGIPQVTNADLIAYHEAILLELRNRLDNYLDLGADDLIAADEGFNFAGQLQATLAEAVEHTAGIRERLVEIQRKDS